MIVYENPNVFIADGSFNIRQIDDHSVVQMRCPHCQSVGTFMPALPHYLVYSKAVQGKSRTRSSHLEAHIRKCPNTECRGLVFALTEYDEDRKNIIAFPPELLNFDPSNLPPTLTRTLKEAITCHSQGAYRASSMMVRRLLEELCHDCGVTGSNLHTRLKALRTQITLPEELFDAMDELKALGNDAAHIEAKAFTVIDREESQLSIELAQEILKARYQHKSLVDRLRARKKPQPPAE